VVDYQLLSSNFHATLLLRTQSVATGPDVISNQSIRILIFLENAVYYQRRLATICPRTLAYANAKMVVYPYSFWTLFQLKICIGYEQAQFKLVLLMNRSNSNI